MRWRSVIALGPLTLLFLVLSTAAHATPGVWTATGSLNVARTNHTATLLPSGKVLVAGGSNGGTLSSTELYDSVTGVWTAAGSLSDGRQYHTATLLQNGKVLVAGGIGGVSGGYLNSAELFDPSTGTWATTGSMTSTRAFHTATLLQNGKVLVAAGIGAGPTFLSSAELYDPSTGVWTAMGSMNAARYHHTATRLQNGKVLVAGGFGGPRSAELYDPSTGVWTTTGSLITARRDHTAVLLLSSKVLVAGGDNGGIFDSAELYDPSTGVWTATGSMNTARYTHTATLLPNGKVLVAGGGATIATSGSAELYDPSTGVWTTTGSLIAAQDNGTATLLPTGKVLVAGGTGGGVTLSSAELYDANFPVAPAITSPNSTTFTVGTTGSFTVTATGTPAPTLSLSGTLPAGVTFNAGSGVLSGTPAAGSANTYNLVFTASNGVLPIATQNFTLTVHQVPVFTSASSTTFTVGTPGSFTVTATGNPAPTFSVSPALPAGLSLSANGLLSGTATVSGTYTLSITATNTAGTATQAFTLRVNPANQAPAITSASSTTFTVGTAGSFTVTATGTPLPTLSLSGTLPAGVTFNAASGVLSGTPAAGSANIYNLVFTATNGVLPNANQNFTLTVNQANQAPTITSANSTTFTVGTAGSFTVTATGNPAPTLSLSGTLPAGVTFNAASGVLSGTPTASGSFPLTFTASNGILPNATQNFTLTVSLANQAPAITSASSTTFTVGTAGSFTVTATGTPTPTLSVNGALPAGVTFTVASGVLSGTPTASGSFPLTFTATNGVLPDATQSFTLTVNPAPAAVLTSPAPGATFTATSQLFNWTSVASADEYSLWAGSTVGGYDYYYTYCLCTSATAAMLPTDGSTVYVRLWSRTPADGYRFYDYTFTAVTYAVITSPAPGSTLTAASVPFSWTSVASATEYSLWAGSTLGGYDYFYTYCLCTSATVTGLPTNGSTISVRMWTRTPAENWTFTDYLYNPLNYAVISSPVPGSTLSGASQAFTWTSAATADTYSLWAGSTLGGSEFYNTYCLCTSTTATGLPTDSSVVYVRLWTHTAADGWTFIDYNYIAAAAP